MFGQWCVEVEDGVVVAVVPLGPVVATVDAVALDEVDEVDAPAKDIPSPRLAPNEHAATAPTASDRLSLTFMFSVLVAGPRGEAPRSSSSARVQLTGREWENPVCRTSFR